MKCKNKVKRTPGYLPVANIPDTLNKAKKGIKLKFKK
jgi:hypothetical protein